MTAKDEHGRFRRIGVQHLYPQAPIRVDWFGWAGNPWVWTGAGVILIALALYLRWRWLRQAAQSRSARRG